MILAKRPRRGTSRSSAIGLKQSLNDRRVHVRFGGGSKETSANLWVYTARPRSDAAPTPERIRALLLPYHPLIVGALTLTAAYYVTLSFLPWVSVLLLCSAG